MLKLVLHRLVSALGWERFLNCETHSFDCEETRIYRRSALISGADTGRANKELYFPERPAWIKKDCCASDSLRSVMSMIVPTYSVSSRDS